MNDQNQPMDFNPGPTPASNPTSAPAKKNNTVLIVAIIVVIVLCCCCIGGAGAYWLWNNGDKFIRHGIGMISQML